MRRAFWIVVIGLLLLTRIPVATQYFSIDNVNLALSLERFDPLNHRPQPPGYPFFVAFASVINDATADHVHVTFLIIALLTSALCLPLVTALGTRFFSGASGHAAALLLLVNPVFWQAALFGPLRGFLALFSVLTAYCAWRAWSGEARWVLWGALALGAGGGFRPDLLPILFPLWLISAFAGTRSLKMIATGLAIIGVITLTWTGALAVAVGGLQPLIALFSDYLSDQSCRAGSPLCAAASAARRQLGRLIIWNGLAVVGWIWAVPFALRSRSATVGKESPNRLLFMAVWLVPGLLLQALVHIEEPAHTLFSIPALCLLGGWTIATVAGGGPEDVRKNLSGSRPEDDRKNLSVAVLATAMTLSTLMFLNFFTLPPSDAQTGGWRSLKNAALFGIYEASLGDVRWLDDMARTTMKELEELASSRCPCIIVSTEDANRKDWFTNWRIVRYYAPKTDIWVVSDNRQAQLIRRDQTIETRNAVGDKDPIQIPVPRGGRVIWLMEHGGALHRALESGKRLEARGQLFFTDIPSDAQAFEAWNYQFVPTSD